MTPDDTTLTAELRRDEGVEYTPYLDTVDIRTVGVGHNLKAKPIPMGWTYPLVDAQVNQLLADDLQTVFDGLDQRIPWWRNLDYPRQRVLANMCFNIGISGLMGFNNTLAAIKQGRYNAAGAGMASSKWAKQVGARAARLVDMMVNSPC